MPEHRPLIHACFYNDPDTYPPIVNGSRLLAEAGMRVDLFARLGAHSWGVSYPSKVKVQRLNTGKRRSWREYIYYVRQAVLRADREARVYIGHDMHGLLPARLLATRHRRPLVYHCHDYAGETATGVGGKVVNIFERLWARTANMVIVPDQERGEIVARVLRLRRAPLTVANAPLTRVRGNGENLRAALSERKLQFDRIVLRQGRIGVGHAIESTIRSIPHWQGKRWAFVLIGSPDPPFLEHITNVAKELRVNEQLVMLPPVVYDQVASFTDGADLGHALYDPIHINHTHYTTASNKIMEYMAAGLPILVSENPSLRTFISTYQCGSVADETNPMSIASEVNRLLGDEGLRKAMSAAGVKAFEQEYCYERQFAPVIEEIRRLIGR